MAWVALTIYVLGALFVWFIASFAGDDDKWTIAQVVVLWPLVALLLMGAFAWDGIRPLATKEPQEKK